MLYIAASLAFFVLILILRAWYNIYMSYKAEDALRQAHVQLCLTNLARRRADDTNNSDCAADTDICSAKQSAETRKTKEP